MILIIVLMLILIILFLNGYTQADLIVGRNSTSYVDADPYITE
jgi:hypothetical protein